MGWTILFLVPFVLLLAIVAPLWLILHYAVRWRASRGLSGDQEAMLRDLWESADRMETRIGNLERLLDLPTRDGPRTRPSHTGLASADTDPGGPAT